MIRKDTYHYIAKLELHNHGVRGRLGIEALKWVTLFFDEGDSVKISHQYWEELGKPNLGDTLRITLSTKRREE